VLTTVHPLTAAVEDEDSDWDPEAQMNDIHRTLQEVKELSNPTPNDSQTHSSRIPDSEILSAAYRAQYPEKLIDYQDAAYMIEHKKVMNYFKPATYEEQTAEIQEQSFFSLIIEYIKLCWLAIMAFFFSEEQPGTEMQEKEAMKPDAQGHKLWGKSTSNYSTEDLYIASKPMT